MISHNAAVRHIFNFRSTVWIVIFAIIVTLGLSGCRSSHKKENTRRPKIESIKTGKLHGTQKKIVEEAVSWIGTPYRYAGKEKGRGTDCSGMVMSVYEKEAGIKLPRNSAKQAEFCKKLNRKSVKPGDLVFFATGKDKRKISHVGIMIDDVRFVHASTRKGVIVSEVTTPYYERTFMMYGRVPK